MSDETRMTLLHSSTNDLVEELLMWRGRAAELLDRIAELEAEVAETRCDEIDALQARIAELEAAQRWRVVADGELPEKYRDETHEYIPFLVCEGDRGYPFRAMYDGINWGDGMFMLDVTHWMPLPPNPESEDK
jgi:BMFP domain-containing protein YqiC